MRRAWCVLVVALGCKGGDSKLETMATTASSKVASREDARVVAKELAHAMSICDENQLAGFLDFAYLASRAGASGSLLVEASKPRLTCSTPESHLSAVVTEAGGARPIIRWRKGTGCGGSFGYLQLTVENAKPVPRIVDLEAPLVASSAVNALRDIAKLPAADQPRRIAQAFDAQFHPIGPADPDAIAKIVGEDAQIAGARIAVAIAANDAARAQKLAREATAKWPDDIDAWCARVDAETAAGDTTAVAEAKQMLATKFQTER